MTYLCMTASSRRTLWAACWTMAGSLCSSAISLPEDISEIIMYQASRASFNQATKGAAFPAVNPVFESKKKGIVNFY